MTGWKRIKDILTGVIMILFAAAVFFVPQEGYYIIALVIGGMLILYGLYDLLFYFTMARLMVGGKTILVNAVLMLDLGLFTFLVAGKNSLVVMLYLLGVYAFSGVVDILRALEIKKNGAPGWKRKLILGAVVLLLTIILIIFALTQRQTDYLVYGFCIGLVYSAVVRIVDAFRRNPAVVIQ